MRQGVRGDEEVRKEMCTLREPRDAGWASQSVACPVRKYSAQRFPATARAAFPDSTRRIPVSSRKESRSAFCRKPAANSE